MDRIEELMRNARPNVAVPERLSGSLAEVTAPPPTVLLSAGPAAGGVPGADDGIRTFADDAGQASAWQSRRNKGRKNRTVLKAAVSGLAAAAVITVGVVAGNVGNPAPAPAPAASTETAGPASPSRTAPASSGPSPSGSASPSSPTPAQTAPAVALPPLPAEPAGPATSATASASAPPLPAGWNTYRSSGGKVSFDHPGTWTVVPAAGAAPDAVNVEVKDQAGQIVAMLTYGGSGAVGGSCFTEPVPYTVLDYAAVDLPYNPQVPDSVTPRFAFRAMEDAGGVIASYGLTSTAGGQDGKACMIYNLVNGTSASPIYMFASALQMGPGNSPQQGVLTFAGLDAARAYMKTPAYADAKRMITSFRIGA